MTDRYFDLWGRGRGRVGGRGMMKEQGGEGEEEEGEEEGEGGEGEVRE